MSRSARLTSILIAVSVAVVGLAACGSGGNGSGVVAKVGSTAITRSELNHWMSALAGGDFYEVGHQHTIPAGLVSEPANYAACVSHLEAAAASAAKPAPPAAELLSKCQQLQRELKTQAMTFLVEANWLINLDAAEGIKASSQEITKLFEKSKAERYPNGKAEFQRYLAATRRSVADELFVIKLDVLREKTEEKMKAGGKQALAKFTEAAQAWTAKTSCSAGYVVQHCRQYTNAPVSGPSAAVLLEQVAVITGLPCINAPACK